MDLKKLMDELVQEEKFRQEERDRAQNMMNYLKEMLPEEVSAVHRSRARRTVRLMKR